MVRRELGILFSLAFLWAAAPAVAQDAPAENPPKARTILVLDASGSMWGQIDGQNKIVIAREVVGDLMKEWDPEIHLGLIAYGHREKGDCEDIEELVPVGANTTQRIAEIVNNINPKGKTPLSDAVSQAADLLKYTEEAATVILVTDGLETCDADPCAVAKVLEESGIDFTAHVVGFDISEAESKQVACIADNTGGQYFSAGNAGELREALGNVVKSVETGAATDTIKVLMAEGLEPIEDESVGFTYFRAEDADNPNRKYVTYGYGAEGRPKLPPGDYLVVAKLGAATVEAPFTILEAERRAHVVNLDAGRLTASAKLSENAEKVAEGSWGWEIYPVDADGKVSSKYITYAYGTTPAFVLPAGNYQVNVKVGAARASALQTIEAGKSHDLVIDMRAGKLAFDTVMTVGAPKADGNWGWEVYPVLESGEASQKYSTYSYGDDGLYTLRAGEYELRVKAGSVQRVVRVEVKPDETTSVTINLDGGTLAFDSTFAEGGDRAEGNFGWTAYPVGDDGKRAQKYIAYSYGDTGNYLLPTGRYELEVKAGSIVRTAQAEVKPNETTDLRVVLNGGTLNFRMLEGGAPVDTKPGWQVHPVKEDDTRGSYVGYGYANEGMVLLPAGRYDFVVKGQGYEGTTRFEMTAGGSISLDVPVTKQ